MPYAYAISYTYERIFAVKQAVLVLAIILAVSSPLLAKGAVKAQPEAPVAKGRTVKPAERPVLDRFKTQSIKPSSNRTKGDTSAPRKERSGIELNPWVVPNFL